MTHATKSFGQSLLAWLVCLAGCLVGCNQAYPSIAAGPACYEALRQHKLAETIDYLADPAGGGRMTGSRGNDRAGDYIASRMRQAGLTPAGDEGTFFQGFPMPSLRVAGPRSRLSIDGESLAIGDDADTMAAGAEGAFDGPLVFVGFGVADRRLGYDDYAGIDVSGAVVMILLDRPAESASTDHRYDIVDKLDLAARRGAVAALVVVPEFVSLYDPLEDVRPRLWRSGRIPAMRISRKAADRLLGQAGSLEEVVAEIRNTLTPQPVSLGVTISGEVHLVAAEGRNVVGLLPATESTNETTHIVVGGHYDHLSAWGGYLARDEGFGPRPGADDNASGISVVLAMAEAMADVERRNCHYVFTAFSGEEYFFVGSKHYVRSPAMPLERCKLMVNLDQVGHVREDRVTVLGSVMDGALGGMLRQANDDEVGMKLSPIPIKNIIWSDNASFVWKGVDTLFFHGGRDWITYHQRSDLPETVNHAGLHRVARLVFETLRRADAHFGRPR